MTRARFLLVPILVLLLAAVPPVSSSLVLSDVYFTPAGPLVTGSPQHVVASYAVIPSGATTFPVGHSLQMQTDLVNAKWSIQVTLDGRNAAEQSATGNAAFVNGEILSYSTDQDVGMVVTIDGTAPPTQSDQVMVLQGEEIDNSGNVVPGSVITISQPVAGTPVPTSPSAPPAHPTLPATPAPTQSAGVPAIAGIAASSGAFLIWRGKMRSA
jgi:hypothetical protein